MYVYIYIYMCAGPWDEGVLGVLHHPLQFFLYDICNVYHYTSFTKLSHSRQPQMTLFCVIFILNFLSQNPVRHVFLAGTRPNNSRDTRYRRGAW